MKINLREENYNLNLCGQEKTGNLVEYFSNYKKDNKLKERTNIQKLNLLIFSLTSNFRIV